MGPTPDPLRRTRGVRPQSGSRVRLTLLEGFDLLLDGEPVPLPPSSQKLVAFLALHDRPIPRAHVAGTLWWQVREDRARASLRSVLWRLRRSDVAVVESVTGRLGLAPDVSVDARELVTVARRATERSVAWEDASIGALLRGGELLPGWYEDWVLMDRQRIHQLRLHALESLCTHLVAERDFSRAVEAGLAAVASEPLRESAHLALATAYLAEGNRGEAVRDYRLFCELLRSELEIEPSSALEKLVGVPQSWHVEDLRP
jgi:DNA-binding SARP family transcriptional activator